MTTCELFFFLALNGPNIDFANSYCQSNRMYLQKTNAISPKLGPLCVTYFLQKSVLVEQTETKVPTGDYHLLQNVQKISYKLIT
jgi:hypothetical protein